MLCSTRITSAALGSDLVVSANSIRVHDIYIGTSTAGNKGPLTIEDAEGNTVFTFMVGANSPIEIETTWIADRGLTVKALSSEVYCIVLHSQDGA
jgi:hypothetical protein